MCPPLTLFSAPFSTGFVDWWSTESVSEHNEVKGYPVYWGWTIKYAYYLITLAAKELEIIGGTMRQSMVCVFPPHPPFLDLTEGREEREPLVFLQPEPTVDVKGTTRRASSVRTLGLKVRMSRTRPLCSTCAAATVKTADRWAASSDRHDPSRKNTKTETAKSFAPPHPLNSSPTPGTQASRRVHARTHTRPQHEALLIICSHLTSYCAASGLVTDYNYHFPVCIIFHLLCF